MFVTVSKPEGSASEEVNVVISMPVASVNACGLVWGCLCKNCLNCAVTLGRGNSWLSFPLSLSNWSNDVKHCVDPVVASIDEVLIESVG